MRNLAAGLMVFVALLSAAVSPGGGQILDSKSARQQIRSRQSDERKALKLKEKYTKASMRNTQLPKSERVRMEHQMKRERRELRQRQKGELQDFQDRQRSVKEAERRL